MNRFEQRRQRNRAALLEAAIELFQAQGLRATKLEDICERADVSPRTFFNHFETREHLYRAIARQRAEQLAQLFDGRAEDARPCAQQLPELFGAIGAYLGERPAWREMVAEMLSQRFEDGGETARIGQALQRFVERGIARGDVADRHSPELLAELLLGALIHALGRWCANEDHDLEEDLGRAACALLELFA